MALRIERFTFEGHGRTRKIAVWSGVIAKIVFYDGQVFYFYYTPNFHYLKIWRGNTEGAHEIIMELEFTMWANQFQFLC